LLFFGIFTFFFWKIHSIIAIFLLKPISFFCQVFEKIAGEIANIPGITSFCIMPKMDWILAYYLFLGYFFWRLRAKKEHKKINTVMQNLWKKALICILFVNLLFTIYGGITREFTVHFLDVGQGDSCLIQTKSGKVILIDGGGDAKEEYDPGKRVLLPYLAEHQIGKIDCLIVSHADFDHIGGTIAVLEKVPVKQVILGKQFEENANLERLRQVAKKKKVQVKEVETGMKVKMEKEVTLDVIWPDSQNQISENGVNNNSFVFRLEYANFSMLFTGDIEKIAEEKILEQTSPALLKADILKVGHHGSKTSSIPEFVQKVNPKIALIGVGENNRFGHPNGEVVKRLEANGAKVCRTDEDGEIWIQVNKKGGMKVKKWLQSN